MGVECWLCLSSRVPRQPSPAASQTWHSGLPLLAAYAIVGLAPIAVGRWLFAPELRDAAYALQKNTVALRLAALWTPATALLYLCGLLLGVAVWVAYQRGRRAAMLGSSAAA